MKLTKILICLLIFWTGTLSASPYFSFKKYQVEDGLSTSIKASTKLFSKENFSLRTFRYTLLPRPS